MFIHFGVIIGLLKITISLPFQIITENAIKEWVHLTCKLAKLKDTMQKRNLQNGYGRSLSIVPNDNLYATFATYRVAESSKRIKVSSIIYQARKSKCCIQNVMCY